jgi:hypothetical protein
VGEPHLKEVRTQAQKYWDALSYETRLKEVIRSRNAKQVAWGGKFQDLTAEQIAAQNEVPSGIVQEFELKDCHHDCQDCHLEQDFKNSSRDDNLSCSSDENNPENEIAEKKNQLQKLKKHGENLAEIAKLEQEIKELIKNQPKTSSTNENSTKSKNDIIIYTISGLLLVALVGFTFIVIKTKRKKHKIK